MDGPSTPQTGWLGRLELRLEHDASAGATRLTGNRHVGPLLVQRPFYPEGRALPHLYLLHPPGGVVGGDRLEILIEVGAKAGALSTTPAAQKLYRSSGAEAVQENLLRLERGATLEWLPSEVIVFDGANVSISTRVSLAAEAAFIGWEIGCFGRVSRGEAFSRGRLFQRFELEREGVPLLIERYSVRGGSPFLSAPWGLGGRPVVATLCAVPRRPAPLADLVAALRADLPVEPDLTSSVTSLDEALVVRVLGRSTERVRALLSRAWATLRPALLDRTAIPPRIWHT
jgi:urease accessory protein